MSESWSSTRESINRLKAALRDADEDTRYNVAFWAAGLLMMALAIVGQFGALGWLFCSGVVIYAAGRHGLEKDRG